jgi:SAM-dependent methyltransferase
MPAGDFDYEAGGGGYAARRRTDPRIAGYVWEALGDAASVINVGAGAGSYEPHDRYVVAVEPSAAMRAQRVTPAVIGVAEALPFDDDSFDVAMATVTIHQWLPRARDPGIDRVARILGGEVTVTEVPIPIDCVDGFVEAFYARPEALLDPVVRRAQSAWAFVAPEIVERGLARLRDDLASGEWDARHGHLRTQPEYLGALRLITALA